MQSISTALVLMLFIAFGFWTPSDAQASSEDCWDVLLEMNARAHHDIGVYPEEYNAYPHPIMDDRYSGQLVISEFPAFLIPPILMTVTLLTVILKKKNQYICFVTSTRHPRL